MGLIQFGSHFQAGKSGAIFQTTSRGRVASIFRDAPVDSGSPQNESNGFQQDKALNYYQLEFKDD